MSADQRPAPCIVLFDGVCGLCNRWVTFLIRRDPGLAFVFVPNQSEAGRELMRRHQIPEEKVSRTVYVIEGQKIFSQSTSTLRIASRLPFPWRLASGLRIIPASLRDAVYRIISTHRYQWFGKQSVCRVPTPEERARFIQTREELESYLNR